MSYTKEAGVAPKRIRNEEEHVFNHEKSKL
jgi:hypothetical protein